MESDHRRFVPAPALLRIAASSGFHQELAHGAGGDSFIAEDNEGVKRYRITPGADTGINTLAKMTAIR